MWWRIPSGLRFVQAAFRLTLTNSINFRGRTLWVHGLVLILKQSSAHCGSHSRNVSREESHGPAGTSVTSSVFPLRFLVSVAIFSSSCPVSSFCSGFRTPIELGMERHPLPIPCMSGRSPRGLWGASDVRRHSGGFRDSTPIARTDRLRDGAQAPPNPDSHFWLCL